MNENFLVLALAVLNLIAGLAIAVLIARRLRRERSARYLWLYAACLGLYFAECVAFAMGMATQVCTLTLAIGVGIVLGGWLPHSTPLARVGRLGSLLGGYGSLPTVSFCLLLTVAWMWSGAPLLSSEAARQFGIPDFLPWPLNTVLGFCVALGVGTVVLKCVLTGLASLGTSHWKRVRANKSNPTATGSTADC